MNINDIFKKPAGLYFINAKNNIMESILEIKKESIKNGNLRIFALGFNESIKSRILETNKKEYGNFIIILGNEKKQLKENYKYATKIDSDVILINLNNPNTEDKKILIHLFECGYKVVVFSDYSSESKLNKNLFLDFYKKLDEDIEFNLIYDVN